MDFSWTKKCLERIDRARRFAETTLAPRKAGHGFDRQAWDECARERITGLSLPEAWGGEGLSMLETVGVLEALGRGGADRGFLFALGAHLFGCAMAIAKYGSAEQLRTCLTSMASGDTVAALAVTEPAGGSSVSSMGTRARRTDLGYTIDGVKTFITNGPVAKLFLLIASETPERQSMGLTAFLVPGDAQGLSVERLPTLGMQGAPMARVVFERCQIQPQNVLGRSGGGLSVLLSCMQYERTGILAGFLGAAERDLAHCVGHAKSRHDQQGPLARHQAVAHRLGRVRCRLESARWLMYRGAWEVDQGKDSLAWPAMVKLNLSEALVDCAMDVLRIFAGSGWLDEQGVGTALRDVIGTLSASGTSDAQLNLIASRLGSHPP